MIAFDGNHGHVQIKGPTPGDPDETIFIRKVGRGDRHVVLVPGNNCSGRVFHPVLRCFSENRDLHGRYTVYAMDYRGSGLSTYNAPITALSDFARDFETALRMTGDFPDSGVALVGYSMGAAVAMEMMVENPSRYDALISLAGVGTRGLRAAFISGNARKAGGAGGWAPGDWVPVDNHGKGLAATREMLDLAAPGGRTFKSMKKLWEALVFNDILRQPPGSEANPRGDFRAHPDFLDTILDTLSIRYMPDSLYAIHRFNISSTDCAHVNADGTVVEIPGDGRAAKALKGKSVFLVKAGTDRENAKGDIVIPDESFHETAQDLADAGNEVSTLLISPGHGYDHGFPVAFPSQTARLVDCCLNGPLDEKRVRDILGTGGDVGMPFLLDTVSPQPPGATPILEKKPIS